MSSNETFACIAYSSSNQTLCAGTNHGNLYIWKKTNYKADAESNGWQLTNVSVVRSAIKQCVWGFGETLKPIIGINCVSNVYILKELPLLCNYTRDLWAIQTSANQLLVEHSLTKPYTLNSDISITNLCLSDVNLVVTNGKIVMVYKVQRNSNSIQDKPTTEENGDELTIKYQNSFNCDSIHILLYEQNVILLNQDDVKVLSLNGVKLQELNFSDNEGKPIGADVTDKYLTIFTLNGYIKIYDLSRHEPKLLAPAKCAFDLFENFGEIIQAKCNHNGSLVALTIADSNLIPDGHFYFWQLDNDSICGFDFLRNEADVPRLPISFHWNVDDHRLVACESRIIGHQAQRQKNTNLCEAQTFILFLSDKSVKVLEVVNLSPGEQLLNLCTPFVVSFIDSKFIKIDYKIIKFFTNIYVKA